ncbi:MAG: CopG family transcriptional regulator [Methylococcaceae bacterium]
MSTTVKTEIPDQLWQQAQNRVDQGGFDNIDDLIAEPIRRYLESHQEAVNERFIREDIEWGLHGRE